MKCVICGNEIERRCGWDKGNNAEPVTKGRCCDACNQTKVIPARIREMKKE